MDDKKSWAYSIDSFYRHLDWVIHRTGGGLTEVVPGYRGHSLVGLTTFLLLLIFLTFGPSFRITDFSAYFVLLLATIGHFVLASIGRRFGVNLFWAQFVTIVVLIAVLFAWPLTRSQPPREFEGGLYPHLLLPLVGILAVVAAVAGIGASLLLMNFREGFPEGAKPYDLLQRTELFESPDKNPELKAVQVVLAALTVPLRYPVELLLPPSAFVLVFANGGGRDFWGALLILIVSWGLVALGDVYGRLRLIRDALRRLLLYGGLWLTSLAVIGLALAWFKDIGYVRTVMEGDRKLILQYVLAAYVLFWWHEYWVNRAISQRLLAQIAPSQQQMTSSVSLPYRYSPPAEPENGNTRQKPRVEPNGRTLQVHGASRFVTVGTIAPPSLNAGGEAWQTHDRSAVFARFVESATDQDRSSVEQRVSQLNRRLQAYFTLLNVFVLLPAIGLGVYVETRDKQAVVTASEQTSVGRATPYSVLFSPTPTETKPKAGRPRVILVAASGGGTRAALFATSVLDGLNRIGVSNDIRLVSGVSGGGVALAYFTAHRESLVWIPKEPRDEMSPETKTAWDQFHDNMGAAFIVDVLRGGSEARIAQGTLLGNLLAESLARKFGSGDAPTFGSVPANFGLFLNTTLCGEFPPPFGALQNSPDAFRSSASHASGLEAGSRLIFTNLDCGDAFSAYDNKSSEWDRYRSLIINDPTIAVPSAAALNANFPPVFPNAPVDVTDAKGKLHRYWVTDGGAEENRGAIALLLALKDALEQRVAQKTAAELPDICLIVAEASAGSVRYRHDRGVNAASSASGQLSVGLANVLLKDCQRLYRQAAGENSAAQFDWYVLPMPSALRFGGVGTHWMLPESVRIHQTDVPAANPEGPVELSREHIVQIIRDLHPTVDGHRKAAPAAVKSEYSRVWSWIDADPLVPHQDEWQKLRKKLVGQ